MTVSWECINEKCKKTNNYSKIVHRNEEIIIEMKGPGPKKVTVKCRHCGTEQVIEVND